MRTSSREREGGFGYFRYVKLEPGGASCARSYLHDCPPLQTLGLLLPMIHVPIKFKIYHPLTIDRPFLDQYLPLGSINLDIHFKSSQYLLIDCKNNEK